MSIFAILGKIDTPRAVQETWVNFFIFSNIPKGLKENTEKKSPQKKFSLLGLVLAFLINPRSYWHFLC